MRWKMEETAHDVISGTLPPLGANEVELVLPDFRGKIIEPCSQLLKDGDPDNKMHELQNITMYSDWKELPNIRFRIMMFPVCPHSDIGTDVSEFRISAYVEAGRKEDWPENWICYGTRFCLFVINHKNLHLSVYKKDTFSFSSSESDRGWQGILTHAQLVEEGFLSSKGDLLLRAGVYPMGAEVNRASRDHTYDCRKATGFVGLQNHGATCYMNALLQSLYSITKFRKAVYLLNFRLDEMIGPHSYEIMKRLEARMPNYFSSITSQSDNYKSGKRKSHESADSPFGHEADIEGRAEWPFDLDLDENECCAILMEEEEEQKKVPSVGLALQNLFYKLRYSPHAPPCKELMRSFGWDSSDMFTQQDSHELLKLLLDKMEEQMKGTPVEGSVKHIFEGEMETYIECIDIDYKSCRLETFEDIQLDIQGCSDIYDSLKKLTEAEILDGENMYEAEGHGKQRARKGIRFRKFPPACIFLLKRFTFDLQRMDTVKLNDRFEFYKEIDLSPFNPNAGKYVLQAVSVHHGSINSGHYYAFAASEKGEWYRFDDENVSRVSEYAVIGDNFGGEEPDCFNYCASDGDITVAPFRRPKNYNAYILIYVLKSAIDDILGPCDPVKENYSVIARCCLQERLNVVRHRVRERLSQFIKVKVFEKSDFEGLKFLDQPFIGWLGGTVITFERSTTLTDALRNLCNAVGAPCGNDASASENFHIMGLNRALNRFCCLADIRKHDRSADTLQSLISHIRRDVFQVYDPTLYILYVPRPAPHISTSTPHLLAFLKYFDIFCDQPGGDSLICVDIVYLSPDRSISQVGAAVLRKVLQLMSQDVVTPHNMFAIERALSRIEAMDVNDKSMRDVDFAVEQIIHEESLHLNWYVELSGMYETLTLSKTLREQQLTNGNLLVFNFRPTEAMHRMIEETDSKFTQKEDFEPTRPVIETSDEGPFLYLSPDYEESDGVVSIREDTHNTFFRDLQAQWAEIAEEEVLKHEKLNIFPIYDFPSFIDWRLNVVTITFKLYNPFEQLGSWVNCCNSPVKINCRSADTGATYDESNTVVTPMKTVQFTLDLRVPCKHALRYVCWSMGLDPAHVLFYSHPPHRVESIWLRPASIDDFYHRDGSLGLVQKPLSDLFSTLGKAVRHDGEYPDSIIRSGSINSNAQCSDQSLESSRQNDFNNSICNDVGYDQGICTMGMLAYSRYNRSSSDMGCVDTGRTIRSADMAPITPLMSAFNIGMAKHSSVVSMAVFPQSYSDILTKCDDRTLHFTVQIFNHRVECIGVCMGNAPSDVTVAQLCDMVRHTVKLDTNVKLRMVECLSDAFSVVDPSSLVRDLPHYVNTNIRNLLAAPLRVEPDWSVEDQEQLQSKQLLPLTVLHQTSDHETFGHPFQVLVDPCWTMAEIKCAIKEKLKLPKREWDRWSFFQQMDNYNRTWKANDDVLDWEKSHDIKLLAEHPKPYDKSRSFCAMRIG
ncbi:Ubiquitin carboxyl-terminal hydrolase 12 [Babesia sp. Xinjiang]|uniref:Ubiquitin carboxyl-terminal hydrolase 12 n=1 Tax=Babesia sp. Xinjiang TaxID=462227 RepID=UPI000A25E2DF|nr:Ubiquitin carboxyl-terminal hydrolase 12 [Babesia sp. Xinjiang]ORM41268.1 Ubiquitin carboxyl-terminal hydrolase 12 [Babesia sp. Xinjiang]